MAQKEGEVLVLHVDTEQYQKDIAEATAKLVVLKNQVALLDDAMKKGNISVDDYAKRSANLKAQIQTTSQQQNAQIKVLNQYSSITQHAAGSVDQLKAQLAVLTTKYNALSEEERTNTKEGQLLAKQTKDVSDKLKEAGLAVGDTRRFVGGYTEAIGKAISGNSQLAEGLQMVKEGFAEIKGTVSNIAADIKTQWNGAGKAVDGTTSALGGAQKAAVGFGIGLKAIGIGLLITAISAVVTYFSRFEEGIEKMEQFTAGLGGAIDLIAGRLGAFGKQIVDVFTSPVKYAEKLGNFLKKAFTDPVGAVQDLKKGVDSFTVDLVELTGAAIKAGKEMANLTKLAQELEDAENAVRSAQAKQRGEVELLMLAARDRSKSEQERVNGLKRAGEIEKALTAEQLKFANQALEIAKKRDEIDKRNGKLAEEKSKERVDAEVKVIELENASAIQRQAIRNRESGLIDELNADRLAKDKAYQAKLTAQQKQEIELRLTQAKKGSEEELKAQIDMLAFERDQKQKEYVKGTVGFVLAQKQYEAEALNLTQEFTKKQLEIQVKRSADYIAAKENEFGTLNELSNQYYTEQDTALLESLANQEITLEEYAQRRAEIELDALEQQRQNALDTGQSLVDIDNAIAQKRIQIKQDAANKEKTIEDQKYEYISAVASVAGNILQLVAGQSSQAAEFAKAVALFQIGIDTAKSISQIITLATAPTPDNLLTGGLTVPIKIATLSASVLGNFIQARQLLSKEAPEAPKFAQGENLGYILNGPSHANGGIGLYTPSGQKVGEAEGNEIIMTSGVTKNPELFKAASFINELGGGKALMPSRHMQFGGSIKSMGLDLRAAPGYSLTKNTGIEIDYRRLAQEMSKVKVVTLVSDVKAGLKKSEMKQRKTDI